MARLNVWKVTRVRSPTAHASQRTDDEVRADPSHRAEAVPTPRARRRDRREDDARPHGGVSRRWRANRDPSLRNLHASTARGSGAVPGPGQRFLRGTRFTSSRGTNCANASIVSPVGRLMRCGMRVDHEGPLVHAGQCSEIEGSMKLHGVKRRDPVPRDADCGR